MSWKKDLKSKPTKGRYFPIRFGDAVRLLKELELVQFDGSRLAIRMGNLEGKFDYGHLLIDIMPEEDITIYSLPEDVAEGISRYSVTIALIELAKIQKRINNFDSSKYSYFCAYLNGVSKIVITRKDVSKQKGRYRGDSKFSNAFKAKKVNRDEAIISTVII